MTRRPRSRSSAAWPALVGDIGATNARFALLYPTGDVEQARVLACRDFPTIEDAIESYFAEASATAASPRPLAAALAIAGPVSGDHVALTNHPWSFSTVELRRHLAFDRLVVVNDFAAVAHGAPHLPPDALSAVGGGTGTFGTPIGIVGPGSGLGVGGVVPSDGRWSVLPSEGGHVTMAAASDRESVVLDRLRKRFDHLSAERVLSGPGVVNLYQALAEIDGVPPQPYGAAEITDPQNRERDPQCRETVELFCAMLGTVASNLALTLGARGGIYIAGGIVPKLGPVFAASRFRERFENKGRMRPYLADIPTFVITHPFPAFVGLRAVLAARAA
ncbi:MAG: glucokinase [Rhodospirillaceae bacterium]|nr:glucokinase [Rhodospirillaceae bacterium]